MTWTDPATAVTGELTSTFWNEQVRDNLKAIGDAWTSYTPTAGGGLTIGNGVLSAAYRQMGKTVKVRMSLTLGTTSAITANVTLSLPVAPVASIDQSLSGWINDTSAGATGRLSAVGAIVAGSSALQVWGPSGSFTATAPFTWASTDKITITGEYEAA